METKTNRRNFIVGASCSLCGSVFLPSCTQVPLTNRSQLNLYDSNLPIILMGGGILGTPKIYPNERSLNQEVEKTYSRFLSKAKEDKIRMLTKKFLFLTRLLEKNSVFCNFFIFLLLN